jgi:hypothetical protein
VTDLASLTLASQVGVNPTPAGVEIPNARRLVEFADVTYARCSYGGGGAGDASVAIMFSTDGGAGWQTLVPAGPPLSAGTVLASQWTLVQWVTGDVLIVPVVYGTSLLGLGLYALSFVELQLR